MRDTGSLQRLNLMTELPNKKGPHRAQPRCQPWWNDSRRGTGAGGAHLSLLQRRGTVLAVPEGRLRIAQHLSAGYAAIPSASPAGTTESHRQAGSAVPVGTWFFPRRRPSTEVPGYSQASLRDRKNWAGGCKKLRCARAGEQRRFFPISRIPFSAITPHHEICHCHCRAPG